jgi:hypothetical protein
MKVIRPSTPTIEPSLPKEASPRKLRWEGDHVYGTWIEFIRVGNSESGKTTIWDILTTAGMGQDAIGEVKWFGPWRQYAFFPSPDTIYEKTCLSEIAAFCRELMEERKTLKRRYNA